MVLGSLDKESVVSRQSSVVSCQLSVVSRQLSVMGAPGCNRAMPEGFVFPTDD
jgi:hypothetical protein